MVFGSPYEMGEIRELALEAQTYVNESKTVSDAIDRGREVTVMLNESIDYGDEVVALHGLYKRTIHVKRTGEFRRFLDTQPLFGVALGFLVVDSREHFEDIPDSPRQRQLLSEIQEFSDGPYVVCNRLKVGEGSYYEKDCLVWSDISLGAHAPVAISGVFREGEHLVDQMLSPDRQEEADRIIASAGPYFVDLMEKIKIDMDNSDLIKGLSFAARKFRGICELGDHLVRAAAHAKVSALFFEKLNDRIFMLSGDLPISLMIQGDRVIPASLSRNEQYFISAERLAIAPFYKPPKEGEVPQYEDSRALYLVGRLLDNMGYAGEELLLPLEHLHDSSVTPGAEAYKSISAQEIAT